jgi:hypothetical protein
MILTYIELSRGIIGPQPVANIGPAKPQVATTAQYRQGIAIVISAGARLFIDPTDRDLQALRQLLRGENIPRLKPRLGGLHGREFWRCCHLAQGLQTRLTVAAVILEHMKVQPRAVGFVKISEKLEIIRPLALDGLLR